MSKYNRQVNNICFQNIGWDVQVVDFWGYSVVFLKFGMNLISGRLRT